jgi:serine protease Do
MSEFNNNNNNNKNIESTEEFPMSNYSGYNASHSSNYDENNNNSYDYEVKTVYNKEKKHKNGKRIASYVAVGLICSVLGGTASGIASIYVLPKTGLFKNTPLYQNLSDSAKNQIASAMSANSNNNVSASPTVASSGGLTVSEIAKKVGPAVVGVSTKSMSSDDYEDAGSQEEDGVGSGIIINKDGYILTNYHVINGAQNITITFNNKKTAPAKVVNYDSSLDLAVIKVTSSNVTMPAVAQLGTSSSLEVGDPVVAIGNPMGLEFFGSVTTGVVSALNRQVSVENSGQNQTLIQTDAAINPGNSGGPLVNSQGQVIGITSSKLTGGVEGIGFAIPIDVVKPRISSLTKQMILLGITVQDVTKDDATQYSVPQGVQVQQVNPGSSASRAGLQSGDIITKFGDQTIQTTDQLNSAKSKYNVGDHVAMQVYRNNSTMTLNITLSN